MVESHSISYTSQIDARRRLFMSWLPSRQRWRRKRGVFFPIDIFLVSAAWYRHLVFGTRTYRGWQKWAKVGSRCLVLDVRATDTNELISTMGNVSGIVGLSGWLCFVIFARTYSSVCVEQGSFTREQRANPLR